VVRQVPSVVSVVRSESESNSCFVECGRVRKEEIIRIVLAWRKSEDGPEDDRDVALFEIGDEFPDVLSSDEDHLELELIGERDRRPDVTGQVRLDGHRDAAFDDRHERLEHEIAVETNDVPIGSSRRSGSGIGLRISEQLT
jgi:hypothetical protein